MNVRHVISIVLNAHMPFVRHVGLSQNFGEGRFFEALSGAYLPLLEVFDRLEADRIPFRLGLSLSPTLCHMLQDEGLLGRYLEYVDRQIEFGLRELDRTADNPELHGLARTFYDKAVDRRVLFTERYGRNLLGVFEHYQKKGRLEILTTAATYAFLPFYTNYPEAVQAQLEAASASYRLIFNRNPQGFWLPGLGWSAEMDPFLRLYNFSYTILEAHGLILGKPAASRGSFYPVKTPSGLFVLARDYYAHRDLAEGETAFFLDPVYRDYHEDVGYELPAEMVQPFLSSQGVRTQTGYKYWAIGAQGGKKQVYDPVKGSEKAREQARSFLDALISRLRSAGEHMEESPVSLCAWDTELLGRWYEGPQFIEALFREGVKRQEMAFMNPGEYLFKQDEADFETVVPEYSSGGKDGYAEMWIDASNDWMYRHSIRALERMIEMAERFPNDSGLKERALNQAAREILLVQDSEWAKMLYRGEYVPYVRGQIEGFLRNFTTIYESLGSNYISTEWLTGLERRHNIFPAINYRIFRRKR
jgi:1,4-alpha-glucan branching enzyme